MTAPKFVQLVADGSGLVALDEAGGVWRYYSAMKGADGKVTMFARWVRLTAFREDSKKPAKEAP